MQNIITSETLTGRHTAYVINAPEIAMKAEPGQLVMVRSNYWPGPIPHAIADYDRDKGTVTIVVRTPRFEETRVGDAIVEPGDTGSQSPVGPSTEAVLSRDPGSSEHPPLSGDNASFELTGPLGRPGRTETTGKIVCVTKGSGVAALFPRLRQYKEKGWYTIVIAGYSNKDDIFWAERLDRHSDELYVVTDDGSFGIKGPVRQTLKAVCEHTNDIDQVFAVGSLKLLKISSDITRNYMIPTLISLNAVLDGEDSRVADAVVTNGEAPSDFDWNQAADLDGHMQDFDELTHKLGIQIAK
ncbi:MAG: hypothetical protein JSW58_04210 [Candidatus Latescibacterota bacterium]|nr:MAG: hypothetical protein JSW58_04210 [Candidatus Latescibacterota bacterium]